MIVIHSNHVLLFHIATMSFYFVLYTSYLRCAMKPYKYLKGTRLNFFISKSLSICTHNLLNSDFFSYKTRLYLEWSTQKTQWENVIIKKCYCLQTINDLNTNIIIQLWTFPIHIKIADMALSNNHLLTYSIAKCCFFKVCHSTLPHKHDSKPTSL